MRHDVLIIGGSFAGLAAAMIPDWGTTTLFAQGKYTPDGEQEVDEFKESSVKGVFVAGDLSNPMQNGTFAIASGTMAGVAAHRSLMFNL